MDVVVSISITASTDHADAPVSLSIVIDAVGTTTANHSEADRRDTVTYPWASLIQRRQRRRIVE